MAAFLNDLVKLYIKKTTEELASGGHVLLTNMADDLIMPVLT